MLMWNNIFINRERQKKKKNQNCEPTFRDHENRVHGMQFFPRS